MRKTIPLVLCKLICIAFITVLPGFVLGQTVSIKILTEGIDANAVCGFANRSIRLYVPDAGDKCYWTYPLTMCGSIFTDGPNQDTVTLRFLENPQSGDISVEVGDNNPLKASISLTQIQKAKAPQNLRVDFPICEGVNTTFKTDEDLTNYAPGTLCYEWRTFAGDGADWGGRENCTEGRYTYNSSANPLDLSCKNGKIRVTPYTCDVQDKKTSPANITLTPFVIKGLFETALTIQTLTFDAGLEPPAWVPRFRDANTICSFYSNNFNSDFRKVRLSETNSIYGSGDGYVYLQAGDYVKYPEPEEEDNSPERYYNYNWSFDVTEFEMATEYMATNANLKKNGFGVNNSRVVLKVLGAEKTHANYTVKVTVRCDTCITKGGNSSDFTVTSPDLNLIRKDSIKPYSAYEFSSAAPEICVGLENTFNIKLDNPEDFRDSRAKGFMWVFPNNSWVDKSGSADSDGLSKTVEIGRVRWTESPGDSAKITIYPYNECFINLKEIDKNGKEVRIFVKNPPLRPVISDAYGHKNPHHTDYRIKQLDLQPADTLPVLLCNYNEWLGQQEYGLKVAGDTISSFGYVQFATLLTDNDQIWVLKKDGTKNEGLVRININPNSWDRLNGNRLRKIGFYGKNACGVGDTGVYFVNIIDTLNVYSPIAKTMDLEHEMTDTNVCEGWKIVLTSNSSQYRSPFLNRLEVLTDRIDYEWQLPDTWYISDSATDLVSPEIYIGQTSGTIQLRYRNQCGASSYRNTWPIKVHPFTRVDIQPDVRPCEGEVFTYYFDTVAEAEAYQWNFPSDWEVVSTQTNQYVSSQYDGDPTTGRLSVDVKVGADSGYLWVVGKKETSAGCNFTFENFNTLPHHADSVKLLPKNHTKAPIKQGEWPDTICARKITRLIVKADSTDENVYFSWYFPDEEWEDGITYSPTKDTVYFNVPLMSHVSKTIKVVSHRTDCEPTNIGDTLTYNFWVMDTIAPVGPFYDLAYPDNNLNHNPCEGDTVYYALNTALQDERAYAVQFAWNDSWDFENGNEIDQTGWKVLNASPYQDTLVMVVGRSKLKIGAAIISKCDTSSYYTDTISPISLVVEKGAFESFKEKLCTDEKVEFTHKSIANADAYIWNAPWFLEPDTVYATEGTDVYKYLFENAYDTGYMYVEPYNVCGKGPSFDSIHITDVLYPPQKVGLRNIADFGVIGVGDTLMDTVCLRSDLILSAVYKDAENPDYVWSYEWNLTKEDASVSIVPGLAPNDSLCTFTKVSGGSKINYIGVAARHESCLALGDTLYIELRSMDTASIPIGSNIRNYVYNASEGGGRIETAPCGTDSVSYYFANADLDATISSYTFIWNGAQRYNPTDSTMDGTNFKLLEIASDPTKWDTLKMSVGNLEKLNVQIRAQNYCGTSTLDNIEIATQEAIVPTDIYALHLISADVCNKEDLVLKVDTVGKASSYEWNFPWPPYRDTVYTATRTFNTEYTAGKIFAHPLNGCGPGHATDTLEIKTDEILLPPAKPLPIDFAASYQNALGEVAIDTICLRAPFTMSVQSNNTSDLVYQWSLVDGNADGFVVNPLADSICTVNQAFFSNSSYKLYAAARLDECTTFGDTLEVKLFAMDTVAFTNTAVTDSFNIPLNASVVDLLSADPTSPISLSPCGTTEVKYQIKSQLHWSIDTTTWFSWGNREFVLREDSILGETDWKCLDSTLLPDVLYALVGNEKTLNLQLNTRNRCGYSRSKSIEIEPSSMVVEKPVFKPVNRSVCDDEKVSVSVNTVPFAAKYVWYASWKVGTDTTEQPIKTYENYTADGGMIKVWAINSCGSGPVSDSLLLPPTYKRPQMPKPLWFDNLVMVADTVFDTICLNGGVTVLKVKSDISDTLPKNMVYKWEKISGPIDIMPDNVNDDTLCSVSPMATAVVGDKGVFMVASRRASCSKWSDTLYISLSITDTVNVAALGNMLPVVPDTFNLEPCPGTTITLAVENKTSAPAYRWILPQGWSFASADTTAAEVDIVVGAERGEIKVSPLTDKDQRQCNYYAIDNALSSPEMAPHQPLVTEDFKQPFIEEPCVGSEVVYEVEPTAGAVGYRWEFPMDWKVVPSDASVVFEQESDSVVSNGPESCLVTVGSTSGKIKVYALDSCGGIFLVKGDVVEKEVRPVDTARLTILADRNVCIDSLLTIEVGRNELVWGYYDLSVRYSGPDLTLNTFDFPLAPDSSQIDVFCRNRDSVIMTFTPRNELCPTNIKSVVHVIIADTIPTINGAISGPSLVCMHSYHSFKAHADMDDGTNVSYHWEVPEEGGWEIISGGDSPEVKIKIGVYTEANAIDTIFCYPSALCGTAAPFAFVLNIDPEDKFLDEIIMDEVRPCTGSDVGFRLGGTYDYEIDSITFAWSAPAEWIRLDADSLPSTSYTVSVVEPSEIEVRYTKPSSCGFSEALKLVVDVKDIANKASLEKLPYPCKDNENVVFTIRPDDMIDSVVWAFPSEFVPFLNIYTRPDFAIKYDSVVLVNPSVQAAFDVDVRSWNNCGFRDTTITIIPVDRISNFASIVKLNHYCPGDTAFAYIDIPQEHLNKGTEYRWIVPGPYENIKSYVVDADNIAVLSFASSGIGDSVSIGVYAYNDCNTTDSVFVKTTPFSYKISGGASDNTAVYMQKGVELRIDSVNYNTVGDYKYEWSPGNRLTVTGMGTSSVAYKTLELVKPLEEFYVKATEIKTGNELLPEYMRSSSCVSYDTVYIVVDSTFAMAPKLFDTACVNAEKEVLAGAYGGNTQNRFFDWYRLNTETAEYELLEDHSEKTVLDVDKEKINLMVVGWDTTYLYAPNLPDSDPIYVFSKRDTQYIEVQSYSVGITWVQPGKEEVSVPYGSKITLSVNAVGGAGKYIYNWEPKEMFEAHDTNSSSVKTLRLYKDYAPILTVKDEASGCDNQVEISIVMKDVIGDIPNAFSPNGDGINDVFMSGVDLIIYNRYGVELFKSTAQEGWDGTYKGKVVSRGDYLYVVSIVNNGETYVKKGVVTVF